MDIYLQILSVTAILVAFIVLVLWTLLKRSRNERKLNMRDASLSTEELEEHAKENAQSHLISRKRNALNWPVPRMSDNYNFILSLYRSLNEDIQNKRIVPPAAEWLLDNFYIIEDQVKGLRRDLNKKSYSQLPVLKSGHLKGYARVFAVAVELVAHTDGQINEKILSDYLKAYQTHSVLFDREIWTIPTVIRLALIEQIRYLCESIKNTQMYWQKADEIFDRWHKADLDDSALAVKAIQKSLESMEEINPSFIEHLFLLLRRKGTSRVHILRAMDENLARWGETTERITQKEHNAQSGETISMSNCITSLHYFSSLDWAELFESASHVEQILKQDPDGTYPQMDSVTRNYYRRVIERKSAIYGVSELQIARMALSLASQAFSESNGNNIDTDGRACHVGYYLVGKGSKILEKHQERINPLRRKLAFVGEKFPGGIYFGSIGLIMALLMTTGAVYANLTATQHGLLFAVLASIVVWIPASEIAVTIVNWVVSKALEPAVFPMLELKEGIPEHLSTIVAIPTLLPDVSRVTELLEKLESHYVSNREDNLYFVLIGAFRDSDDDIRMNDKSIIDAALDGIKNLNLKYAKTGVDKFYFFHRTSQFNELNNKWFGWERKRGALMEFNDLLLGADDTSFSYFSCEHPPFNHVKYVITLDSDTLLPMGMARKMIGTMAHPLNRPVVDHERGVVVEGYGLMQPRIEVDIESSNESLFSRIFTGQEGIDPYANAISDVYQDLFGEGIFTGKGIYDLRVFQSVLRNAIPDDAILSHDLLEGSYARTGLVTKLKLVDSSPSKYNSFAARQHRWVRGDWQLLPLLFGKVANKKHGQIANPLSPLSKWKIFDNLRRSLVPTALMILAASGFCILPGSIFVWLGLFVAALSLPFWIAAFSYVFSGRFWRERTKRHMPVMNGLKASLMQSFLQLILLPYQAWSMLTAIVVTLVRVLITRKNLLEWVTSAAIEKSQKNTLKSYWHMMRASQWQAPLILVLTFLFKPAAILVCLPFFLLWGSAPFVAYWISKNLKEAAPKVSEEDQQQLGRIARKTWRYFEEFANANNHYLAPDNYQADPPHGIAHRTSPTNIGLGLLAALTARDLGYISTSRMMELVDRTVTTIEILEKWNGHLYNWYDTRSLKPLRPLYTSTVDSGNLVGYLITLGQGLRDLLQSPLVDSRFCQGIRDTLLCSGTDGLAVFQSIKSEYRVLETDSVNLVQWKQALDQWLQVNPFNKIKNEVWKAKIELQIQMYQSEMAELMPSVSLLSEIPGDLMCEDTGDVIAVRVNDLKTLLGRNAELQKLPVLYKDAASCAAQLIDIILQTDMQGHQAGLTWLNELTQALSRAIEATEQLISKSRALTERINALIEDTKFLPLFDKKRQLFSIGFNLEESKLSNSYYDLLASEARQTSYICIARGEIPMTHWFKLGRALTIVDGFKGLISWTGTMFEYLMPLLIMKTYKNTLLDETYSFVIKSQKKYGKQRGMPWGVSESGFNDLDAKLDYQYKAIGIPWLGLKRGLIEDAVTAPYATILALLVDPEGAVENMKRLQAEGLEGAYGFYEAADFTPERLSFEIRRTIVKSFMAHHQGMSLVAINNFLHQGIMQRRFHADPAMNAARLLLQEKVPANILFTKDNKERIIPYIEAAPGETAVVRRFSMPDPSLPRTHILSNGNYSIMISDRGTGYSKSKTLAVNRWRSDSSLDPFGMFIYLRNVDTHAIWSAAYSPMNVLPDQYEVQFTADKATFSRRDGDIKTKTEIAVASGDNVEIRRVSLKNGGVQPFILEVTSYFEVVLASQVDDVAHPAFSNLFIETDFEPNRKCLIANRRPRSDAVHRSWIAHTAIVEGETVGDVQYETDRMQMIGRDHQVRFPAAMEQGKPLSNTVGPVLDPVMSLRVRVKIDPGQTVRISYLTTISESQESLLALIDKYASPESVENAFRLASARSMMETRYLNLDASETELYQDMISHILYLSPTRKLNQDLILQNRRSQSALWRYGISGDRPIVLVVIDRTDRVEILGELIKAHEYWRLMDLNVDLVILSKEEYSYTLPLHALISDIVLLSHSHEFVNKSGDVFILDMNKVLPEDISLLYAVARIILKGDGRTLAEQINLRLPAALPSAKIFTGQESGAVPHADYRKELDYFNGLGGFSPDGQEYVIRLEKGQITPAPWANIIANPDFGFLVSEAGSGFTWSGNSRESKLTPWSNDAISDSPGEVIYMCDDDTGELWTVTSLPIRDDEPYTIRHGFGYSVFEHDSHGIEQSLTQYVPVDASVKISLLRLKNTASQSRHLSLAYYVQPVLGVSTQTTALHIRSNISQSGVILLENAYNEEFADKICYVDASNRERQFTCDRQAFFGAGDLRAPDSLFHEALSGTSGTGFDPCAAIRIEVDLEPDERKDIVFLLGTASSLQEVEETTQWYRNIEQAEKSLLTVIDFWKSKMSVLQVQTPNKSMNLMLNGWLQYQVISCRLWARSGFYQSGGAYGFRDQLQDCLSIAPLWPEIAHDQICLHAGHQFEQGDVQHWWHEPSGKGIRSRFSDDRLWLPFAVAEYIRMTGDQHILTETRPFLEENPLLEFEDERYGCPTASHDLHSIYEHCIRAIEISLKFGEHGLPLMGFGDWNDGMSTVGNKGSGESVWLGWFLASVLDMMAPICMWMGDSQRAENYKNLSKNITEAIERSAWDGNWYRRAYFDNGQPLGSILNHDCKIDSIAQTWAVLSGKGNRDRAVQAMRSLEAYLVQREDSLIRLLTPPFDQGDSEPGYIKGYVPGVRENGGQYTHAAAWAIIAFAKLGDGDKAAELFDMINPINHTRNFRDYSRYKLEPYVMAADVYAAYPHTGRGGWSWYTGSAGWMYQAGLNHILGFQKIGNTLVLNPCIPGKWKDFLIDYQYQSTVYHIKVINPDGVISGIREISIDGTLSAGNVIVLVDDGIAHNVLVIMGA